MQHNSGVTFYTLPWTGVGTAQALPIVASQFDRWQGERGTICARQLGFKSIFEVDLPICLSLLHFGQHE
jgi:hypothetical protein